MNYALVILTPDGMRVLPFTARNDNHAVLLAMITTGAVGITFACEVWRYEDGRTIGEPLAAKHAE